MNTQNIRLLEETKRNEQSKHLEFVKSQSASLMNHSHVPNGIDQSLLHGTGHDTSLLMTNFVLSFGGFILILWCMVFCYLGHKVYRKRQYFHRDWIKALDQELQVKVEAKQAKAKNLQRFRKNNGLGGRLFQQVNPGERNQSPGKRDPNTSALSLNYTNSAVSGNQL